MRRAGLGGLSGVDLVRSLTREGRVLCEPGVWEGEEKAGRRVREKIEAEDKVC
jgi:hypothetical protein